MRVHLLLRPWPSPPHDIHVPKDHYSVWIWDWVDTATYIGHCFEEQAQEVFPVIIFRWPLLPPTKRWKYQVCILVLCTLTWWEKEVKSVYYSHLPGSINPSKETAPSLGQYVEGVLSESTSKNSIERVLQEKVMNSNITISSHGKFTGKKQRTNKGMSNKEMKALGMFKLPSHSLTFDQFIPLHNLWKQYIHDLLNGLVHLLMTTFSLDKFTRHQTKVDQSWLARCNDQRHVYCISKQSNHLVCKSKCPQLIGIEGIVVMETAMTFQLITPDDVVKSMLDNVPLAHHSYPKTKFKLFIGHQGSNYHFVW